MKNDMATEVEEKKEKSYNKKIAVTNLSVFGVLFIIWLVMQLQK